MGPDLTLFYQQNNFRFDGKLAYGIYKSRLMSVCFVGNYVKFSFTFNSPMAREKAESLSFKIKQMRVENKLFQKAMVTNISVDAFLYQSADFNQQFLPIIDSLIQLINQDETSGIETCPLCGGVLQTNSPFVRVRDVVIQAHDHCINQLINTSKLVNAKNDKVLNTEGIKVPLLSSIVTSVVIIFIMFLLGFTSSIYFAGISGWLCFTVLRYVFAKKNLAIKKSRIVMVGVASLLTLILSLFFSSLSFIYMNASENISFLNGFLNYFTILKNSEEFTRQLLLTGLLGLAFCIFPFVMLLIQFNQSRNQIKRL